MKSWNTIFSVEELEAQERQEASSEATAKAWGGAKADLWLKRFMLQLDFIDYIATVLDALLILEILVCMNLSRCMCIFNMYLHYLAGICMNTKNL